MGLVEQEEHVLRVNSDTRAHATTPFPVLAQSGFVKPMIVVNRAPASEPAEDSPTMAVTATRAAPDMEIAVQTTKMFASMKRPVEKKAAKKREVRADAQPDSATKDAVMAIP
jgi:hypothetical protein